MSCSQFSDPRPRFHGPKFTFATVKDRPWVPLGELKRYGIRGVDILFLLFCKWCFLILFLTQLYTFGLLCYRLRVIRDTFTKDNYHRIRHSVVMGAGVNRYFCYCFY